MSSSDSESNRVKAVQDAPMLTKEQFTVAEISLWLVFTTVVVSMLYSYRYYLALPLILCLCCRLYKRKFLRRKMDVAGKSVLITGCDTGFGHHLVKYLDDHQFTVYAGVYDDQSDGAESLRERESPRIHVIKLDVTKDEDAMSAVKYITKHSGKLWGVVNNAGINFLGDVELCTVGQYKRCADVNLYGMIRVTKACLPLVRASKGRIVNISSVKGRYSHPGDSAYIVTKHGVETLSDSLRLEMLKFGVKVSIVEPGAYSQATSILGVEMMKRIRRETEIMWEAASEEVRQTYGRRYVDQACDDLEAVGKDKRAMSPCRILEGIEDALISEEPQIRYLIGGSFDIADRLGVLARVYHILPPWFSDIIVAKMTGCANPPK